jgi:hypothetical protein
MSPRERPWFLTSVIALALVLLYCALVYIESHVRLAGFKGQVRVAKRSAVVDFQGGTRVIIRTRGASTMCEIGHET